MLIGIKGDSGKHLALRITCQSSDTRPDSIDDRTRDSHSGWRSSKMLIILIIVLVLVFGGGGGYYGYGRWGAGGGAGIGLGTVLLILLVCYLLGLFR
jgi:hypothetical protein